MGRYLGTPEEERERETQALRKVRHSTQLRTNEMYVMSPIPSFYEVLFEVARLLATAPKQPHSFFLLLIALVGVPEWQSE